MIVLPLQDVLESLEAGARPSGGVSADSGEIVSVGGEHLDSAGGFDFTSIKRIPREFFHSMRAGKVAPRDILIVKDGATTGKTSIVRDHFPFTEAAVNEHVFCVRVDKSKALPEYIFHFLFSPLGQRAIHLDFRGATVGGISREFATKVRVPLPALADQLRIAKILDKADALRAKRRAAISELDGLAQAIFIDTFGEPSTNPKGWRRTVLGDLIAVGPQNGLYRPATDYGSGTPIVRIDAFYDGAVTGLERLKRVRISEEEQALYGLRAGEIVINRVNSRDYLGKSAVIPDLIEPTVFESNMMRFDVRRDIIQPTFLIQYLRTPFIRSRILQAAKDAINQSSINQQDVKAFPVFVPPMAAQHLFAQRLASSVRLHAVNRDSLAGLDSLFTSLQHRAFKGEL
jgi:type I restriction enzyme, S subunit